MKTSVELNEAKLNVARKLSNSKSVKELLDHALDALIAQNRRKSLLSILGTDFYDGDLGTMRERKNATSR